MSQGASALSTPTMAHLQICTLHETERRQNCCGTLRRGGLCRNKAKLATPGFMPTCKIHQHQLKKSAWCKAPLACGFNCSELLEWKPHSFQLCPRHREGLSISYFLEIPVEIRCRIYRLLLPDKDIPAQFYTSRSLTTHGGLVCTAILCVNRQIHEEATGLLYSTNVYEVSVSESSLSMCNRRYDRLQYVRYHSSELLSAADALYHSTQSEISCYKGINLAVTGRQVCPLLRSCTGSLRGIFQYARGISQ
jgi:hypothetical protein